MTQEYTGVVVRFEGEEALVVLGRASQPERLRMVLADALKNAGLAQGDHFRMKEKTSPSGAITCHFTKTSGPIPLSPEEAARLRANEKPLPSPPANLNPDIKPAPKSQAKRRPAAPTPP